MVATTSTAMTSAYPGDSDFANIIHSGTPFVDKSLMIKELLDLCANRQLVTLLTRPRRFGKSTNLSMLRYFFTEEVKGLLTKGLFADLKITTEHNDYVQQHQGQYPVIFMNLKTMTENTYTEMLTEISLFIQVLFQQYPYLLTSHALNKTERETFRKIYQGTDSKVLLQRSLWLLSTLLCKHHGRACWILIDEYDVPLLSAHEHGFTDDMVEFMRKFLGSALKENESLASAVLTGVLRIAKESLFSDVNNINCFTVLDEEFSQYFGFTESEVMQLIQQIGGNNDIVGIRQWYNGYRFGNTQVYNPWSIMSYLARKSRVFEAYWVHTSANMLLRKWLFAADSSVKEGLEYLIQDNQLQKTLHKQLSFADWQKEGAVWTLLVMTGYLRAEPSANSPRQYVLSFPNEELKEIYGTVMWEWFVSELKIEKIFNVDNNFVLDLMLANMQDFKEKISEMIIGFSYHDVSVKQQEGVYHGFFYGAFIFINRLRYTVHSNRESGYGRFDIAIIPHDPEDLAVIIELKAQSADKKLSDSDLNYIAEQAFAQIVTKDYAADMRQHGVQRILKIGIAFAGKQLAIVHNASELGDVAK